MKRLEGKGYLVLGFFGPGYRISLQEMQLIMDVSPLRIDSLFVRGAQEDDLDQCQVVPRDAKGTGAAATPPLRICCVLSICVLDCMQPVRITEAEVVRVRKRSRGLCLSSMFGSGQ